MMKRATIKKERVKNKKESNSEAQYSLIFPSQVQLET